MEKRARLVLLRHGKSVWNESNLFTGWVDIPLSIKGIEEAYRAGDAIAHIPFDIIFTSSLIRAQMTAMLAMTRHASHKVPCILHHEGSMTQDMTKIFSKETESQTIPVIATWHLNERMYGELQGLNKDEVREKYGEEQFKIWRRSYEGCPPGGESLKLTSQRTLPFFKTHIVPHLKKGSQVLIAAHGNSLRSIVMELDCLSEEAVVNLEIPTGEPLCYDYVAGKFQKSSLRP